MKKLTSQRKLYQLRKSKYILNEHNKAARLRLTKAHKLAKSEKNKRKQTLIRINAPENFAIGFTNGEKFPETRFKLLNFIERIKAPLREGKKVHISFRNTKWLDASGTLVFVAEFERIITKHPGRVSIDYPNDDVVEQLFQHIGLLQQLGLPHRKEITAENVRYWNYVHGTNVDTTAFKSLFFRYAEDISEDVRSGLFDSMSEAVTNSFQHAYPCKHKGHCSCEKGWWMFAKQENHTLTVVMYDAGIGIPSSLRSKPEVKEWLASPYRRLKNRRDTALIDIAVESHRTSTKLPHRGKGLPEMLEFVKHGNVGGFIIFSGAGAFSYSAENHIESGHDFAVPVVGTLIQWEIPLPIKTL